MFHIVDIGLKKNSVDLIGIKSTLFFYFRLSSDALFSMLLLHQSSKKAQYRGKYFLAKVLKYYGRSYFLFFGS